MFDPYFYIEQGSSCQYDHLNITVNDVTSSYCGRNSPPDGVVDGPVMIHFHSDSQYEAVGFSLFFQLSPSKFMPFTVLVLRLLIIFLIIP